MGVIVLIVDDDDAVRFFHRIIVSQSRLAAEPLTFRSGEEAIEYMDQNVNETDNYLLLLDINMPVMNGWDVLDAISKKSYIHQVHIVLITASIKKEDQEKAKLYSMVIDVVEKPISDEDCRKIMNFSPMSKYYKHLKRQNRI